MIFTNECEFENTLTKMLTESYGWEPEILRYKTEQDLLNNWAKILFENNRSIDRLNDYPLTDGESIRIYNKERLVCDVLNRFCRMDRELFNKSVQAYIADSEKNISRLMDYAKVFKVEKRVKDIIGVWL